MEPIAAANIVMNFATAIIDWYGNRRKEKSEDNEKIAGHLRAVEQSLSEYAELVRVGGATGRGLMMKNRYYLEGKLHDLAHLIDSDGKEHRARAAIDRLTEIKVHDGQLVPEVSAMIDGIDELSPEQRHHFADELQRASGEFKAAADFISAPSAHVNVSHVEIVSGDKITTGNISGSSGIAVGKEAQAQSNQLINDSGR